MVEFICDLVVTFVAISIVRSLPDFAMCLSALFGRGRILMVFLVDHVD